jgi:hypothetical protein
MGGSVDGGAGEGSPKSDDVGFTALSLTKYELTSYVYDVFLIKENIGV